MLYLDASVVLATVLQDAKTARARGVLASDDPLAVTDWTLAETTSVILRQQRGGSLTRRYATNALSVVSTSLQRARRLPIHGSDVTDALTMIRSGVALYPPDALHLAACVRTGATLVTLDERFARVATQLSHPVRLL